MRTFSHTYILYAGTVFLSSFLLFQVQPLIGKHILPWFGGSSAVWITALFFFMIVLAFGYVYALILSSFSKTLQLLTHGGLIVIVGLSLLLHATAWPSAITPLFTDASLPSATPFWAVCYVLMVSIGLPFLLLSSTSSLLQYWYGSVTKKEPFSLYAVSNTGSLLGLISYPLIFERWLPTLEQGVWWTYGIFVYITLLVVILLRYALSVATPQAHDVLHMQASTNEDAPSARTWMRWFFIASVPVMTMLTASSYISGYVASVPFLWIVPLSLYLISFIVSFRGGVRPPPVVTYVSTLLLSFLSLCLMLNVTIPVPVTLVVLYAALFSIFHLCHEALYESRPSSAHLTSFYVALSFGGVGASVLVLSSSYVLPIPIELIGILTATTLFCVYLLLHKESELLSYLSKHIRYGLWIVSGLLVVAIVLHVYSVTRNTVETNRNFFGYKAVTEGMVKGGLTQRTLTHGTTNHGFQILDESYQSTPLAYYSVTSGVAKGFSYLRFKSTSGSAKVGVIGLGSGTLASYCQSGDEFIFYEIDPQIIALANRWFSYLELCPQAVIQQGDARILLESDSTLQDKPFDYLILDAYADDMVPIHLMTTEAIAMYTERLATDGMLAIHISSRYLDLLPVVRGVAEDNGLHARYYLDTKPRDLAVSSHWVLLAKENIFKDEIFADMDTLEDITPLLWTDTYSSLLPLIKW